MLKSRLTEKMRLKTPKYYNYTVELNLEQKHNDPKGVAHFIRHTPPLSKLSKESLAAALRAKNATAFFGLKEGKILYEKGE